MAGSSTSLVQVSYAPETTFGVIDVTAKARDLSVTGETLAFNVTKTSSNEINDNRGSTSAIATGAEATGGISAELRYGMYDELIAATLQNPWEVNPNNAVTAELTYTATTITADTGTTFATLKPGQWFSIPGSTLQKNKVFRVSRTVPPTATVITLDPNTPAVPGTEDDLSISTSRLTNGKTMSYFTFQRGVGDASEFFAYRGMTPSQLTMNLATGSLTTLDFTLMGRDAEADDATMLNPTQKVAMPNHPVMSGVQASFCQLWADGVPLAGTFVNSISMSYDNALRMQNALCSLGAIGIGSGSITATFDLEVYFQSGRAFYDEFLANKDMEFAFSAFDTEGNGYMFTLPKGNISTYTANASAKDQDLMAQIQVTALLEMDSTKPHTFGKLLLIDRMGAPVAFI